MSVLGGVFDSLKLMTLLQLLLAFVACTGYAMAQGSLVGPRLRRFGWSMALVGASGFAIESSEWMRAAMLITFAIAGMGMFVAAVWLTSRVLDLQRVGVTPPNEATAAEIVTPAGPAVRPTAPSRPGKPAHST